MTLSNDRMLAMYRTLVLIRQFELRAIEERRQGLIPGFIHPYIGEEACAVGACAALNRDDVITSTHRGHGHLIAKGGDARYMMAELAARETGYCAGKGGSLHMTDFDLGIMGANGIVAGGIPMAVGAALAFKKATPRPSHRDVPPKGGAEVPSPPLGGWGVGSRIALSFFGDGATNEGAFHEALNLAGLWKLPIIFFCENNQYGEGTPQHKQAPVSQLSLRAAGYAMPGVTVDGNDVLAVYEATCEAVARARHGDGPTFIEGLTYRYRGHYEGDPQVYRPREEVEHWQTLDPLPRFKRVLVEHGITESVIEDVEGSVETEMDAAITFAKAAPPTKVGDVLIGVYGNSHAGAVF